MAVIHTNTILGVFAAATDAEWSLIAGSWSNRSPETIFPPLFFSVIASLSTSSVQTGKGRIHTGHLTRHIKVDVANVRSHGHVSPPLAFTLAPSLMYLISRG